MHNHLGVGMDFAEQCLTMAEKESDTSLLVPAHVAMGVNCFFSGNSTRARTLFERGYEYYDFQKHQSLAFEYGTDPGVWCLSYGAWSSWPLGYPDEAVRKSEAAISLAEKLSHPFSLASALAYAAWLNIMCRDERAALEYAERSLTICVEFRYPQIQALAGLFRGLALAELGQID